MSIQTEIKGDKLIITVDVSDAARKAAQPSSTGKMLMIDDTSGFTGIGGGLKLNVMLGYPNPSYVKPSK